MSKKCEIIIYRICDYHFATEYMVGVQHFTISGLVTGAIPTLNSSSYVELDNNALIVQDEPVNLTMESISSPRPQFDFEVVAGPSHEHKHPDLLDKLTPNVGTRRAMNTLVVLLLVVTCGGALEVPPELHQEFITAVTPFISTCECQTQVDPHLAYMFVFHLEFANDACLRCFINCLVHKLFYYKPDETPDYNEIVSSIPFVNKTVVLNCYDQQNTTDMCQLSFNITKCIATYYKI
ncbi:hypothetical protein FQR65_LT11459 [Abscondita terminalis]|nr:hypothetical protein FQR65_LT11459 [Abscondita terminalis]